MLANEHEVIERKTIEDFVISFIKERTFSLSDRAKALEGRVIRKMFTNWRGPILFCLQPGKGHTFFCKEESTPFCFC